MGNTSQIRWLGAVLFLEDSSHVFPVRRIPFNSGLVTVWRYTVWFFFYCCAIQGAADGRYKGGLCVVLWSERSVMIFIGPWESGPWITLLTSAFIDEIWPIEKRNLNPLDVLIGGKDAETSADHWQEQKHSAEWVSFWLGLAMFWPALGSGGVIPLLYCNPRTDLRFSTQNNPGIVFFLHCGHIGGCCWVDPAYVPRCK